MSIARWSPTIQLGHVAQILSGFVIVTGTGFGIYLGFLAALNTQHEELIKQGRDTQISYEKQEGEIQLNKMRIDQLENDFKQFRSDFQASSKDTRDALHEISGQIVSVSTLIAPLVAAEKNARR